LLHRNASQKELTDLEAKRRGLVTAARLDKNEKAKTALSTLDSDIFKARRAVEDDATVKADLLQQLESAKDSLTVAQWEAQREHVRGLVAACANGSKGRRLKELVTELRNLLMELAEEDNKVSQAIREFEPRRLAGVGYSGAIFRWEKICTDLNFLGAMYPLNSDYRQRLRGVDIEKARSQRFDAALEAIDQLEA